MWHTQEKGYGGEPERDVKMLAWKVREMWPEAKKCRQPPEAGRGKEQILPQSLRRECSPPATLMLTQWFWTSGLQNCEGTDFGCLSHQVCYMAVRGNKYTTVFISQINHFASNPCFRALASRRSQSQNKMLACALCLAIALPLLPFWKADVMVEAVSHLAAIRWPQTKKPRPEGGEQEATWRLVHTPSYLTSSAGCVTGISNQACIFSSLPDFNKWQSYPPKWWGKSFWVILCPSPCTPHMQSTISKYCQHLCQNVPICDYFYFYPPDPNHCHLPPELLQRLSLSRPPALALLWSILHRTNWSKPFKTLSQRRSLLCSKPSSDFPFYTASVPRPWCTRLGWHISLVTCNYCN